MKTVFADTFYWIALTNRKDTYHRRVVEFSQTLDSASLVTTDEVLTEFLAFCASEPQLRATAALIAEDILASAHIQVIPQSRGSFMAGLRLP